jgi:uncharacterized protein YndB with AHSA1/START domain
MNDRVEKSITLNAPVDKVWQALTDHVEFGQWFKVEIDGPFVPGEVSRGHITIPGYEHIVWEATIVAMEPKSRFAYTWHPYAVDPNVDYSNETPTRVEFTLAPAGSGTRLDIVETGFENLPAHRQPDALRMNDRGWASQAENLRNHVGG